MHARMLVRATLRVALASNGSARPGSRVAKQVTARGMFSAANPFFLPARVTLERRKDDKGGKKGGGGGDRKGGPSKGVDDWDKSVVDQSMKAIIEKCKTDIASLRVGRAEPGYLAAVTVDGKPLSKVAQVQVRDPQTLTVTLFDPAMVPKVEKEIRESELNLNPSVEGRIIVVPVPRPTNEFKKKLVKKLGTSIENSKVEIRKARQTHLSDLKSKYKLSEDEQRGLEKEIQKLHDDAIKTLDQMAKKKEEDIMK